jgi:hypothetical protein
MSITSAMRHRHLPTRGEERRGWEWLEDLEEIHDMPAKQRGRGEREGGGEREREMADLVALSILEKK